MVWKLQTSYKLALWANIPQTRVPKDPNQRATTVKSLDITEISVSCWKDRKNRLKAHKLILATRTVATTTLSSTTTILTTTQTITTPIKTVTEPKERKKLFIHLGRHSEKETTPQRNDIFKLMQPIDQLSDTKDREDRISSNKETVGVAQKTEIKLQPEK